MKRLFFFVNLLTIVASLIACQDDNLPLATTNDSLKDQLRGTWLPTTLAIKYQVGVAPNLRDTVVTVTPGTIPLLVTGRPNPIMAFSDTLNFLAKTAANLDSFYVVNRGVRQRGYFFVASTYEGFDLLRIGVPTRTAGQISRWNYDVLLHGTVTPAANGTPTYAPATYANYPFTIQELSGSKLVLSLQTPANIPNVPLVPITPANQAAASSWAGRSVLLTATFTKK